MQSIWQWRHGVNDADDPWTEAATVSAFRSSQLQALQKATYGVDARSIPVVRSIVRGMVGYFQRTAEVTTTIRATDRYLLFFDGGSRGNPGPGGAGAVVVRVDAFGSGPRVVWAAAMSMAAPTTTNNQAEYAGLLHGLKAALTHRWRPLVVIGDSQMIVSQFRDSRSPKQARLRRFYGQARLLADALGVVQWHHHVRAYNKMADAAANLAMDTRASFQALHPTDQPRWAILQEHLLGDVTQWRASTNPGSTGSG